jgi:hypothetical protein
MVRTVLLGVAIVVAGCGRAIVTSKTQYAGVIELDGDHSKGMEEANQRMAEHCGVNNYTIVKEGPEATPPDDNKYRVHYQCNTAIQQQPTPAATPAAAPMDPAQPGPAPATLPSAQATPPG